MRFCACIIEIQPLGGVCASTPFASGHKPHIFSPIPITYDMNSYMESSRGLRCAVNLQDRGWTRSLGKADNNADDDALYCVLAPLMHHQRSKLDRDAVSIQHNSQAS